MTEIYFRSPKTTSIQYPWPDQITGVERIMLSAQGDLQRMLSAFFARQINVTTIYSNDHFHAYPGAPLTPLSLSNTAAISGASPERPIVQTRQVILQCAGKTVCTATSTVRITSPVSARLFLQELYAIGQMFRELGKLPKFELIEVGLGLLPNEKGVDAMALGEQETPEGSLWRRYRLSTDGFETDILEVFPSRDMFVRGNDWLVEEASSVADGTGGTSTVVALHSLDPRRVPTNFLLVIILGLLLTLLSNYITVRLL